MLYFYNPEQALGLLREKGDQGIIVQVANMPFHWKFRKLPSWYFTTFLQWVANSMKNEKDYTEETILNNLPGLSCVKSFFNVLCKN